MYIISYYQYNVNFYRTHAHVIAHARTHAIAYSHTHTYTHTHTKSQARGIGGEVRNRRWGGLGGRCTWQWLLRPSGILETSSRTHPEAPPETPQSNSQHQLTIPTRPDLRPVKSFQLAPVLVDIAPVIWYNKGVQTQATGLLHLEDLEPREIKGAPTKEMANSPLRDQEAQRQFAEVVMGLPADDSPEAAGIAFADAILDGIRERIEHQLKPELERIRRG